MKALTSQSDRIIFRPFSFFYLIILVSLFLFTIAIITFFFRELIIEGVGIPSEFFIGFLFLSLFGSYVNIPLTVVKSRAPILVNREVKLFYLPHPLYPPQGNLFPPCHPRTIHGLTREYPPPFLPLREGGEL